MVLRLQKLNEYEEQCIIFEWAKINEKKYNCLKYMFSTLNGVRLTIGQAKKAKKSGNKKGVPDIILPYNNGSRSGLYIELKTMTGNASREQKDYIEYLKSQNYHAEIVSGHKKSIELIEEYINGQERWRKTY